MACSDMVGHQCFGRPCYLHLSGRQHFPSKC